ncbi:MAG: response regulator [Gammaproteobacteria bacterium]|nr:response regulator [Gammaproteobacteria bacterium]MDH4314446.1 response regulator [Gammaproteobacteria bacterium]MDH5213295.1 response regulator [Gammaproteobacteria bacterium]
MNILIVDDETPARDRLRQLIDDSGQHTVIGEAANGEQALQLAGQLKPDVVLLDIRMPGLDGIETAYHFNAFNEPPAVVFTTAYDEYAIQAFEANAIGYILKPVRRERLDRALAQAARLSREKLGELAMHEGVGEPRGHICARRQGELKLIAIADILCFFADQKYVTVVHNDGEDLIDDTLKTLETEFATQFVRIHRAALVALNRIEALAKNDDGQLEVRLRGSDAGSRHPLQVSRRHVADLRRRLKGK